MVFTYSEGACQLTHAHTASRRYATILDLADSSSAKEALVVSRCPWEAWGIALRWREALRALGAHPDSVGRAVLRRALDRTGSGERDRAQSYYSR